MTNRYGHLKPILAACVIGVLCAGCSSQGSTSSAKGTPVTGNGAPKKSAMKASFENLYEAASTGDRETVESILARDSSLVRSKDKFGFTALHGAVGEDYPDLVELLISKGADVSAKNDEGMTPLHIAQRRSVVEVLVRHGADVNARANGGLTPLHVQAQEGEDTGAVEVMDALLKAGADPKVTDSRGETPMAYAKRRNEAEKVALLRAHGAKG